MSDSEKNSQYFDLPILPLFTRDPNANNLRQRNHSNPTSQEQPSQITFGEFSSPMTEDRRSNDPPNDDTPDGDSPTKDLDFDDIDVAESVKETKKPNDVPESSAHESESDNSSNEESVDFLNEPSPDPEPPSNPHEQLNETSTQNTTEQTRDASSSDSTTELSDDEVANAQNVWTGDDNGGEHSTGDETNNLLGENSTSERQTDNATDTDETQESTQEATQSNENRISVDKLAEAYSHPTGKPNVDRQTVTHRSPTALLSDSFYRLIITALAIPHAILSTVLNFLISFIAWGYIIIRLFAGFIFILMIPFAFVQIIGPELLSNPEVPQTIVGRTKLFIDTNTPIFIFLLIMGAIEFLIGAINGIDTNTNPPTGRL